MADPRRYLSAPAARAAVGLTRRQFCGGTLALAGVLIGRPMGACAQPASSAPAVRFTVFAAKSLQGVAFVARPNTPPQKLVFYPTARSPRYEYRGALPLRFVDAATGEVVAEATVPREIRDALLLFSPIEAPAGGTEGTARKSLRYRIAVLDDGPARHGAGGLAILNLSGLTLSGTVNKQPVTLREGLNPTLPVGRSANITLRTTFKQRTYQSYATTVALAARQRALLILFPPFYRGSLEVQSRLLVDEPPGAARQP